VATIVIGMAITHTVTRADAIITETVISAPGDSTMATAGFVVRASGAPISIATTSEIITTAVLTEVTASADINY
jgi:hypothetical protein